MWTRSNLTARMVEGKLQASVTGYGFGLRIAADHRFEHIVAHGGGLPGFGSYMAWLPECGVGLFAMATLTYSGPADAVSQAWDAMLRTQALCTRAWPATAAQIEIRRRLLTLWNEWDAAGLAQIAAVNLSLDMPLAQRQAEMLALRGDVGACTAAGPMLPENWLRGQFNLTCERGTVGVFFTLAPTHPPAVQHLSFKKLASPDERMAAPTGPPAGVSCTP